MVVYGFYVVDLDVRRGDEYCKPGMKCIRQVSELKKRKR